MSLGWGTAVLASMGASVAATVPVVHAMLNSRSNLFGPVIWRGRCRERIGYALTFDDGPWPESTGVILDTLRKLNAQATFFVIGSRAECYPQLIRRMHDEGHLVANHTFDHSHFCMFGASRYWRAQIERTDDVVERIIGCRPRLFRPPMGVKTWCVASAIRQTGHALVTWSRRAYDGVRTTPDRLLGRLVPHTQPGEILVLHDGVDPHGTRNPRPTVDSVEPLVIQLRARGLEPLPLDKMIELAGYRSSQEGA